MLCRRCGLDSSHYAQHADELRCKTAIRNARPPRSNECPALNIVTDGDVRYCDLGLGHDTDRHMIRQQPGYDESQAWLQAFVAEYSDADQ